MTPDPAAAAWLAECWKPCRELPLAERLEKRIEDRKAQRHLEEWSIHTTSPAGDGFVDSTSTGCADIDAQESSEGAA